MTTSVDILFKGLPSPASSPEPVRKNDPSKGDADRVRFDDDRPEYNNTYEKSFSDHLDDNDYSSDSVQSAAASSDKDDIKSSKSENPSPESTDASGTQNKSSGNSESDKVVDQPVSSEAENQNVNDTGSVGDNSQDHNATPALTTKDLATKDLAIAEASPEIAVAAGVTNQQGNQNNISEDESPSQSSATTEAGSEIKASANNETPGPNTPSLSSEDSTQATGPDTTSQPDGAPSSNSAQDISKSADSTASQIADIDETGNKQVVSENTPAKPETASTGSEAVTAENKNISEPSLEQNAKALSPQQDGLNPDQEKSVIPEGANTIASQNSADSVPTGAQEKAASAEAIAIDATQTAPAAAVQAQNGAASADKPSTKASNEKGAAAAQSSSAQSNTSSGSTQQAAMQSAIKNDVSVDANASGQKFDPVPLQPLTTNGQSGLANGSLIAAQDVAVQQSASHLATSMKIEQPITPQMVSDQITVAINKHIVNGQNNFSIRLHPAELGQVDIRLEFSADGKMHASMMVESEKTLSMLQRDQGALEKALQNAGLNLSNKDMNFSLMKQNQENNAQKFATSNGASIDSLNTEELPPMDLAQQVSMGYSNQAVDISV